MQHEEEPRLRKAVADAIAGISPCDPRKPCEARSGDAVAPGGDVLSRCRDGMWQVLVAGRHAALAGSRAEAYALAVTVSSHLFATNQDPAVEVERVDDEGCDPLARFQ